MSDKSESKLDAFLEWHTPNARFIRLRDAWAALPDTDIKQAIYEQYIQRYNPDTFSGVGALHHLSRLTLALDHAIDNAAKSLGGKKGAKTKQDEVAPKVERAVKEWNTLGDRGISERDRAAMIAVKIGVTPQTVRKYLKQSGLT